jgi:hypothetical protein
MDKLIKNWINNSNIPDYLKKYTYYFIKYNLNEITEYKVQRKTIYYDEINIEINMEKNSNTNYIHDLYQSNHVINNKNNKKQLDIFLDIQRPIIYSTITGEYIGYYTGNEERGYKYYIVINV